MSNWVRIVRASLVALGLTVVAAAPSSAAERLADGAITIRASGATMDGIGSGTIVARDGTTIRILTANHVATFGSLTIRFDDGTRVAGHLASTLPDRDLAIVEAEVPAALAQTLHVATLAEPRAEAPVHVWGSGLNGPAYEPGAVTQVGAELPDGAPRGRYALACELCHEGDSGGGVFDDQGRLVGVYIGYFEATAARISVAELPDLRVRVALGLVPSTAVALIP